MAHGRLHAQHVVIIPAERMNIFALDRDPRKAARGLQDLHVGKMLIEACQLLCSAHPLDAAPYRRTHFNHPCAVWTRASLSNYRWLAAHA